MGKRSREKRERRENFKGESVEKKFSENQKSSFERFLVGIVRYGTYLALFTPLILSKKFYFPFVGPKSLFFMALCQIVFFAWLILALNYKQYRPRLNHILVVFSLFLFIFILSSALGADFPRSFWSKYERMTGLLMWFHLFGFFLAISSVFRSVEDWKRIFAVSIGISLVVALLALLEQAGVKAVKFSDRGGATLGNTSFLGTYLLFNVFLALFLFWEERNKFLKAFSVLVILLGILAMYLQGARAAIISTAGGFFLIFLLFLSLKPKRKTIRIIGRALLAISALIVLVSLVLLYIPGNFVHQKFAQLATRARFVNWEMAWKGFAEKPLLGWGPENYELTFVKFFNPCLFIPECGSEIWFDRTHNIILDTLSATGVLGLITYLAIFVSSFYVLGKKYLKEKTIDFWTLAVFSALSIAYFIQNITVFDMVASLMMFILILGFAAFLANKEKEVASERKLVLKRRWPSVCLLVIFYLTFFEFVVQPFRKDALVIKALQTSDLETRLSTYEKTLKMSGLGQYQIRDFFAQHSEELVKRDLKSLTTEPLRQAAKKELDFVINELEKSRLSSPLDFRTSLKLTQVYNVYTLLEQGKVSLAEKYAQEALSLSPNNQQAYWALAQAKLYSGDIVTALSLAEKAVSLEPKLLLSHKVAIQVAQLFGSQEKVETLVRNALEVNPEWANEFKSETIDK